METVIDWNEAPEWAIGHGLIAFQGITRVWFNDEQYAVYDRDGGPYPWGGGKGDTRHNHTRSAIEYPNHRPDAWDGSGLPPAGTVCEIKGCMSHYLQWNKVTVFAVRGKTVLFDMEDGRWGSTTSHEMRPIRTPEQIAAEEREAAIQALTQIFDSCSDELMPTSKKYLDTLFGAIYDAGFRKDVKP